MKMQVHEDDLIEAIKAGVTFATPISVRLDAHFRAVDRALQRARKKGLIRYHTKDGWSLAPARPAATRNEGVGQEDKP